MANDTYFLGQGEILVAPLTSGVQSGGWRKVGDADKFELAINQKFDDIYESISGNRYVAAHIPTETVPSLSLNLKKWSIENLTQALYGTSAGAQVGGSVTGEAVKAYAGSFAFLKRPNVSSVVLSVGGTPLVADTDYTVDAKSGMIKFLSGSTVVTGASEVAVSANYTYAAYAGEVQGFMKTTQEFAIRLVGVNVADGGAPVIVTAHRCALDLPKNLAFLDSKHASLALGGMLLQDTSQPAGISQFFSILKA